LERKHNPKLQYTDRGDFVAHVAQQLERAPYFRRMEVLNLQGAPLPGGPPFLTPLRPSAFARKAEEAIVLDTRSDLSFSAAHVPGALSIWEERLARFAGWFLPYDRPILLVNEMDDPLPLVRLLIRLGYDNLVGYLAGGMLAWHTAGLESQAIPTVTVQQLCRLLDRQEKPLLLDVRSDEERAAAGTIPDALPIHLTQLPQHMGEVPRDRRIYLFCGSGVRSMTAASLLQREGWTDLVVVLGGLAGWHSATCAIEL
jgi:hydroxyacylglutathione hydrolase